MKKRHVHALYMFTCIQYLLSLRHIPISIYQTVQFEIECNLVEGPTVCLIRIVIK